MSSVMENRAAVFTTRPQAVEVHQAGAWCAGELLGWRHDDSGACQMWVRVVAGGEEQALWIDLGDVRLPESPAVEVPPVTQAMPASPSAASLRDGPSTDVEATASLPLLRDRCEPRTGAQRPGGRRRAPESDAVQAAPASSVPVPPPGRHRAPATELSPVVGRHRAADTDLFPAVVESAPDAQSPTREDRPRGGGWSVPAARSASTVETRSTASGWTPPADLDQDLLTRPMRLSDQIPHSRRPRVGGAVSV
ncbi:hypothetical protein ACI8AG_07690 [Blastococcus sp. SYSU DS0552]